MVKKLFVLLGIIMAAVNSCFGSLTTGASLFLKNNTEFKQYINEPLYLSKHDWSNNVRDIRNIILDRDKNLLSGSSCKLNPKSSIATPMINSQQQINGSLDADSDSDRSSGGSLSEVHSVSSDEHNSNFECSVDGLVSVMLGNGEQVNIVTSYYQDTFKEDYDPLKESLLGKFEAVPQSDRWQKFKAFTKHIQANHASIKEGRILLDKLIVLQQVKQNHIKSIVWGLFTKGVPFHQGFLVIEDTELSEKLFEAIQKCPQVFRRFSSHCKNMVARKNQDGNWVRAPDSWFGFPQNNQFGIDFNTGDLPNNEQRHLLIIPILAENGKMRLGLKCEDAPPGDLRSVHGVANTLEHGWHWGLNMTQRLWTGGASDTGKGVRKERPDQEITKLFQQFLPNAPKYVLIKDMYTYALDVKNNTRSLNNDKQNADKFIQALKKHFGDDDPLDIRMGNEVIYRLPTSAKMMTKQTSVAANAVSTEEDCAGIGVSTDGDSLSPELHNLVMSKMSYLTKLS